MCDFVALHGKLIVNRLKLLCLIHAALLTTSALSQCSVFTLKSRLCKTVAKFEMHTFNHFEDIFEGVPNFIRVT